MGQKVIILMINLYLIVHLFESCNLDCSRSTKLNIIKKSKYVKTSGREINSRVGDTVTIIINYSFSSGKIKRWINNKECDNLTFVSKKYRSYGDENCEGCGGYDEYKFVGKKSGLCYVKIGTISMNSTGFDTTSACLKIDTYKVITM